ncbi:MAG: ornithine carbamoyltransferase [Microcystis aeruginosa G13-03]|nr:ornithine carbamoyltransferase [Microcystis aeruginosa G13-03]
MVATLKGRDVLRITDMSSEEISALLNLSAQRTRVSFTVAMYQLGGQVIDLNPSVTQVGRGEPLADTARVLDRYLDILAVRTFKQEDLEAFANYSRIPIINALTDLEHPCQILADLQTIQETFQTLRGINLTYVGDGNNVANSLLLGGALMGLNVRVASPANYQPDGEIVASAQAIGEKTSSKIFITDDPVMAVKDSQVVYTDVWASMGQESLADARIPVFQPYQVNEQLMSHADKDAIILHCLPAHRGEEITDGAIEGVQSKVWEQAENRMHAQKALMVSLLGLI